MTLNFKEGLDISCYALNVVSFKFLCQILTPKGHGVGRMKEGWGGD